MTLFLASLLFSVIVLIYWIILELFTLMFRITGLPDDKARFQVLSILTGAGFTTRESESIVSSRMRRRLAQGTMLFGYVFNVTIRTCERVFFPEIRAGGHCLSRACCSACDRGAGDPPDQDTGCQEKDRPHTRTSCRQDHETE